MSLSTLNVTHLLQQKTDDYINRSNYATLRNSSIQLLPIAEVVDEIKKQINLLLETERESTSNQLTAEACKNQIQEDLKSKERDHQESQQDLELTQRLQNELRSIQQQKQVVDNEIYQVEQSIFRQKSLLDEITQQIIVSQTHFHPEPTQHTHSHPEPTQHTHSHSEPTQHTHSHSEPTQHTHSHPNTPHSHSAENEPLTRQKTTLSQELRQLEETLRNKKALSQQQLNRINEIFNTLNIVLVQKETLRDKLVIARKAREQARNFNESIEKQLSSTNYDRLQSSIVSTHQQLQKKHDELIKAAITSSYQTFLTQLGSLNSKNLNYQEHQALTQIVRHMTDHLLSKAEEQNQRATYQSANYEKVKLITELDQKKNKVAQLKSENPRLHSQNETLNLENKQLENTIAERGSYKDYILKLGFFGLLGTAIATGGGFLGLYMMPTALIALCFAPAAVVSLITVSLFIATLAYTLKNNNDKSQLEHNKTTIEQNNTAISKQSQDIVALEQEVIPSLNERISEAERKLSLLNQTILASQHKAERLLKQAKEVVVTNAMNQSFFNNNIEVHTLTPQSELTSTPSDLEVPLRNSFS